MVSWMGKNVKSCNYLLENLHILLCVTYIKNLFFNYFLLPRYGDSASAEFCVKVFIRVVQTNSLHCRELLYVENILAERETHQWGNWIIR